MRRQDQVRARGQSCRAVLAYTYETLSGVPTPLAQTSAELCPRSIWREGRAEGSVTEWTYTFLRRDIDAPLERCDSGVRCCAATRAEPRIEHVDDTQHIFDSDDIDSPESLSSPVLSRRSGADLTRPDDGVEALDYVFVGRTERQEHRAITPESKRALAFEQARGPGLFRLQVLRWDGGRRSDRSERSHASRFQHGNGPVARW
jgi:hypothetical protein